MTKLEKKPKPKPEPKLVSADESLKSKMRWAFANLRDFNETVGLMIALAFQIDEKISMYHMIKQMPHMASGDIDRLFKLLHLRGRGRYDGQTFELSSEAFTKKGSF
ncbi:MAG TPA: hypothetical protein VJ327_11225 [Patescibacteria group bacterium]|nr:hypothetical protein [Patescibacteria group bacterium]